jgi:hypothetical protein
MKRYGFRLSSDALKYAVLIGKYHCQFLLHPRHDPFASVWGRCSYASLDVSQQQNIVLLATQQL